MGVNKAERVPPRNLAQRNPQCNEKGPAHDMPGLDQIELRNYAPVRAARRRRITMNTPSMPTTANAYSCGSGMIARLLAY
jgi:hypothetical protein